VSIKIQGSSFKFQDTKRIFFENVDKKGFANLSCKTTSEEE